MIRGIEGVINPRDLEVGRFYLDPGHGRGATLFQWVVTGEREGSSTEGALVFARNDEPVLEIADVMSHSSLVLLPPVSIRVDPPSASATAFTRTFDAGMFAVEPGRAIVGARTRQHYWATIDILGGRVVRPGSEWIAFDRWSLVVDEAGEEIPIVSFGDAPSS